MQQQCLVSYGSMSCGVVVQLDRSRLLVQFDCVAQPEEPPGTSSVLQIKVGLA